MKTHLLKLTPAQFCDATDACEEGRKFAVKYKTMAAVWRNCPRVDWLCWILDAIEAPADEKAVRLYMVWCARNTPLADGRTTLALLTDKRSTDALDVAERFAHGNATQEELDAARDAAWAAARAAAWAAARAAAWAAAWAAAGDAAWAAAGAVAGAAAGAVAGDAAWAAAGAVARAAAWDSQTAEFRRVVSNPFASPNMHTQNKSTAAGHTKGPWKVFGHPLLASKHPMHAQRYVATADSVFEVNDPNPDVRNISDWDSAWNLRNGVILCEMKDSMYQAANARLIAAAPELLEALEGLLDQVENGALFTGSRLDMERESVLQARAALSRAKGVQS